METKTVTLTTDQIDRIVDALNIVLMQLGPSARGPEHEAYLESLRAAKDVLTGGGA